MKNEQEFLSAMWLAINSKEREEKQKSLMRELNKRILLKEILAYAIIIGLLAIGCTVSFYSKDNSLSVYIIAILLFFIALFFEKLFNSKSQEVSLDENRNHY